VGTENPNALSSSSWCWSSVGAAHADELANENEKTTDNLTTFFITHLHFLFHLASITWFL
jgi:hypothetical protein